jgi:lipoic acid synthetase
MEKTRKPEWLMVKAPSEEVLEEMEALLRGLRLHTICESASCPNVGVCFGNRTTTFLILGDVCTRSCRFCDVAKGVPGAVDLEEPRRVAEAVRRLGLKHVVVTSVTRDDLEDFGAGQFVRTIKEIRKVNFETTVEVLIPDFQGSMKALGMVVDAGPDVVGHNLETVPRLYGEVRPGADYERSIGVLGAVKSLAPEVYTKSGLMVGLGETDGEVLSVMRDLRSVGCDVFTVGQYLRPSKDHLEVKEYVPLWRFEKYRRWGCELGFRYVVSGPLVRSSFNAADFLSVVGRR